jgi:ligand-binding sensor domain-containing protein
MPTQSRACLAAGLAWAAVCTASNAAVADAAKAKDVPFPVIEKFENFGKEHGIPASKVHCVHKTSEGQLWVGTWNGLCVREADGKFRRYGPEDGLSHKMVLTIAEDNNRGDLWVGTMRGLTRVSAGRLTAFTQLDSGLPNNVVYGVDVLGDTVWAATAAGAGAMDLKTGTWKIYDHNNSVMHEPWCYAIKGAKDKVYIGVWGGGIIEHDPERGSFKAYRDPDGDFHFDLVPDDGPINDITSWLSWEDGILWQCTYFGMARYDGKNWKTWVETKSPLLSNFTQFVWPYQRVAWIGMDKGVSVTDGEFWVNYLVGDKGEGLREIHRPGQPPETKTMATALANCFVLGIYVDDQEAWFATSKGLSRGIFAPYQKPATVAEAK